LLLHKCLSLNDITRVVGSNNQSDRKWSNRWSRVWKVSVWANASSFGDWLPVPAAKVLWEIEVC
jgi:hypothetical protein